jgi:DNA-binding NtrC family response regulator
MSRDKKVSELSSWLGAAQKGKPREKRPCILVVDDDDGVLTAMQIALRDRYDVRLCAIGADVLQHMDDGVDAVVLDIKMSGKDGFWVFGEIRSRYEDVPIIFNSAYQDVKEPHEIVNTYHPFGYIVKGERVDRLLRAIDNAVQYHRSLRAAREASPGTAAVVRTPPSTGEGAGKRAVLVVDDDAGTLEAIKMALRGHFDVLLASTAREAVASFQSREVCAVVVDVRLRGEDGFTVHEKIRQIHPLVPVIFHTAYGYAKDPYEIMNEFRPFGYLTKNGDARTLLDIVGKAASHYDRTVSNREVVDRLRNAQRQMKAVMSLLEK